MTDQKEQKDIETKKVASSDSKGDVKKDSPAKAPANNFQRGGDKREFRKNRRSPRRRDNNRREFDQKILDIRRVTRVSSGGRRFSFAVSIVIGDKKGKIGVGTGKAGDTALAIEKAVKSAKKNMIKIKTTPDMSIPHEISAKYSSAQILIIPSPGRGIVAGSALRDTIELAGLKDINAKILSGSKNKLNIAQAALKAFQTLSEPKAVKVKKDKVSKK